MKLSCQTSGSDTLVKVKVSEAVAVHLLLIKRHILGTKWQGPQKSVASVYALVNSLTF